MNNKNPYIHNLKQEINISPNSSKIFDEMYNNQDILSYSESKSQSLINSKNIDNDYIINNNNQSLKILLIDQQEKKEENINNNIDKDKELSSLQISLSNLLSDRDSKEFLLNKKNNNKIIDISYDISNKDKESDINNNMNNKMYKIQNDEHSSLCNYSNSLYKNKNIYTSPNKKKEYQIEKGEDINISLQKKNINNKTKRIFINNDVMDFNSYYRNNNLSINKVHNFTINNILEYNPNYNLTEYNFISDNKKAKMGMLKNKAKLISNKNIDINKDDSKKFFYNPKTLNAYKNINSNMKKIYKTIEYSGTNKKTNINKTISNDIKIKSDFKKKDIIFKKLIQTKNSSNKKKDNSNISNNSFIKKKKLFYLNRNKSKNKNEKNISFNSFNKTEISINKKNILSNVLMNKIKTEQKKTTNKLLNKINNMNNLYKTSNRTNFLPIFNKIFEKKIKNKKSDKPNNNNKKEIKSLENQTEEKNKIKKTEKKNNCYNTVINDNSHKKIKSQINIVSLLNNFNKEKNKDKKKNKSIYNFGNIFFINQNQYQIHKKNETEINIKNNINIRKKLEIINNFSNYRKKSKIDYSNIINKAKRFNTESDLTSIKEIKL